MLFRSQHGRTVEDISLSAEFDFKFTPVRTPWFKPNVEGSFKILNQALLEDLPGFQPSPGTILEAYDPKGHGLIGFNALLFIIHKWLRFTLSLSVSATSPGCLHAPDFSR